MPKKFDPDDVSEHKLQTEVLKHLTIRHRPNVWWFAIPNAARRSMRLAMRMKAEGLASGVSDLCIMLPQAHVAWLEMKRDGGVQSVSQHGFEARCKRLEHPYCCAYTLDQAIAFLTTVGALR